MGAKIEIFSDGSSLSDGVVRQVKQLACSKCEVLIYDLNEQMVAAEYEVKAKGYGISSYPAVTLNGKKVEIDQLKKVNHN